MDQGTLIELVQQYKHLYDKKHKEFKNKLAKINAWTTIAEIMGHTREEVEIAWTSLRNRFVTERRKIRYTPTGSAATTEWRYFKQMSFLEEHVTVRKTYGNIELTQNSSQSSMLQPSTEEMNLSETEQSQQEIKNVTEEMSVEVDFMST
ncbi:unnamed protein product [Phaedon cochleariae]|uniref:MADF domain-containing protein n=1 Tax=Phaedon cochleariae TaxID=80249 RepID=A0A9N9SC82_PHACE|nr:unnamed protein product [Phaedon cochleariae]